jgi:protein-disulfide isomerase
MAAAVAALGLSAVSATGCTTKRPESHAEPEPLRAVKKPLSASTSAPGEALVSQSSSSARIERSRPRPSPFEPTVYHVPVSERDPQRGARDALVTVVLFGDFECEFTERALSTLSAVEKKYGPDLRIVWKNRPMNFHDHAYKAATLAMKAFERGGSELFWQASELLFQNRTALAPTDLEGYGQQLGLSAEELRTALDTDPFKAKIDEDKALSLRIAFAPTTPSFAINGRYLRGAQSREIFELLIDEELTKARASLASGTPRDHIYEELTRAGALAPIEIAPGTLAADAKKVHDIAVPKGAPRRGTTDPKVVIQAFSDFECPFCRQVQPTLQQLLTQNEDTVQLVFRNYPLPAHPNAKLAAEAAQEVLAQAGNEKFWAYHDLLFANQAVLSRVDLERHAQSLDIDMKKFREALDSGRHRATIQADLAAVDAIGEQVGTPAFLVNGLLIAGAQPIEVFKVAVQRALLRRSASASAAGKAKR